MSPPHPAKQMAKHATSPMWTCSIQGCAKPAVRTIGDCILCDRRLCAIHLEPNFHKCSKWEEADAYDPLAEKADQKELTVLFEKINIDMLAARASKIRQMPCHIDPLVYEESTRWSVMGGMNYHIEIKFEDGISWLARIRRFNATSPPPRLRDHIICSEAATLRFLEQTSVPAPKIYDFALENADNPVGVGYILMDKMPGKSLVWSSEEVDKRKIINQLADVYIELSKYSFPKMGSLEQKALDGPSSSRSPEILMVGPIAKEELTTFSETDIHPIGPCSSLEEYYSTYLKLILDLILSEELYSQRTVDAYLIHRFLLDMLPKVIPATAQGRFYLKHADDKGSHILIDDNSNVTAVIDWERAYTAPKALAFNSPIFLFDVGKFFDGENQISEDEFLLTQSFKDKGHPDLSEAVKNGRLQHFFSFCCGYDLRDWDGFLGLFRGLRRALGVDVELDWPQWKEAALRRYHDDKNLGTLLAREEPKGN